MAEQSSLKITLAQLNPVVGDLAGNARKAADAHAKAKIAGADLVVFPELFLNGYPSEDLVLKPAFQDATHAALERLAADCNDGPAILIGTIWREDGKVYNADSARLGVVSGTSCMGMAFASWTEVSGKPVPKGGSVILSDIRIDKVDDPNLRLVLESGLVPALPRVVELDVLKSVRSMLQSNGGQFQANVDAFAIDSVTAADDKLSIRFDFLLVAR